MGVIIAVITRPKGAGEAAPGRKEDVTLVVMRLRLR
jgi:hypothetical protein